MVKKSKILMCLPKISNFKLSNSWTTSGSLLKNLPAAVGKNLISTWGMFYLPMDVCPFLFYWLNSFHSSSLPTLQTLLDGKTESTRKCPLICETALFCCSYQVGFFRAVQRLEHQEEVPATPPPTPDNNNAPPLPETPPPPPSALAVTWAAFSSFFLSLIPEQPNIL